MIDCIIIIKMEHFFFFFKERIEMVFIFAVKWMPSVFLIGIHPHKLHFIVLEICLKTKQTKNRKCKGYEELNQVKIKNFFFFNEIDVRRYTGKVQHLKAWKEEEGNFMSWVGVEGACGCGSGMSQNSVAKLLNYLFNY